VRHATLAFAIVIFLLGCSSSKSPEARSAGEAALFAPAAMRIHPIFTRIKDFNGDNYPDGIDAAARIPGSVRRRHQSFRPRHLRALCV
jgi:hypothetical protein